MSEKQIVRTPEEMDAEIKASHENTKNRTYIDTYILQLGGVYERQKT